MATSTKQNTINAQALEIEQLKAQIAALVASQATATAQASAGITPAPSTQHNVLGDKTFARSVLELIPVDADYRSDEEAARGVQLSDQETVKRAIKWAASRRAYWATKFAVVAASQPTYVAPASGKWPSNYAFELNGENFAIEFPARESARFIAIY